MDICNFVLNVFQNYFGRKEIFLSHAGVDNQKSFDENGIGLVEELEQLLEEKYKNKVFCSSVSHTGITAGEYLHEQINKKIKNCSLFLAIITENYIRSPHCLYELCVARFSRKRVIAIYANEHVQQNLKHIADQEWRSIDLKGDSNISNQNVKDLRLALKLRADSESRLKRFLNKVAIIKVAERPFVGMSNEEYKNLLLYCQREGITKFGTGSVYTPEMMKEKSSHAKTMYIVSTTGAGLLKTMKEEVIPLALRNGAEVNVIIPDQNSQFCNDVALAECYLMNKVVQRQNSQRISHEFEHSIQYLNEAYLKASDGFTGSLGKLTVYCSGTLLRQTLMLIELDKEHGNGSWGWVNVTMSPLRTTDTPSIAISDADAESGLDSLIRQHCQCMMAIAETDYQKKEINGRTLAIPFNVSSRECVKDYWEKKSENACSFMKSRRCKYGKILIEVAAQHPLNKQGGPNEEFKARLDYAAEQFFKLGGEGIVWVYVPGSQHKHQGISDPMSLSEAGRLYLIMEHKIPEISIYGDDANMKYKGSDGVYNSADECYVTSKLFMEDGFGRLICICSPYQTMRKTFFYIEFGLMPECYGIAAASMYHNPVSEYFGSLYHAVIKDHNWQDPLSETYVNSRKERKP